MIPKFRAFIEDENKVVDVKELSFKYDEVVYESGRYTEVRRFKDVGLMQSTGLKDSKGVEIYESDIVKLKYPYDKRSTTLGVIVKSKQKACFGIQMNETTEDYELYRVTAEHYLEVVGNIYQNPELGIKPNRNFKLVRPKKVYYHAYIKQEENE